jgi:hypothetical protein
VKLSIIAGVYQRLEELYNFVKQFSIQTNKNFELIFVIDVVSTNVLESLYEIEKKYKVKIKKIFNTKRRGRTNALIDGLRQATGNYVLFSSISDEIKENFVDKILSKAKSSSADIIEFKPEFKGILKWNPEFRMETKKTLNISEHPEIFAYTYPINFNKVIKTRVLLSAIDTKNFKEINSRFSHELYFMTLFKAETYVTLNDVTITS